MVTAFLLFAALRVVAVHADAARRPRSTRDLGVKSLRIEGPRGEVLDRYGRSLAHSLLSWDVEIECYGNSDVDWRLEGLIAGAFAQDRTVTPALRRRIKHALQLPEPGLRKELDSGPWRYYWKRKLARGVQSRDALGALRRVGRMRFTGCRFRLKIRGLWRRVYPLGRAAAHVVGMLADDGSGRIVKLGLEALDELQPAGEMKLRLLRNSRGDSFADGTGPLPLTRDLTMARVRTTIDADIQEVAFDAIESAVQAAGAEWGMLAMIDLGSGDILALTGTPAFDPDTRAGSYWPMTHQALFEPGSVIKPLLVGLAVERGVVAPGMRIACCGDDGGRRWRMASRYTRRRRLIVDDHRVGPVTLEQVLIQSSNIGAVKIGRRGGAPLHREMLRLFRLDAAPAIDLPLAGIKGHVPEPWRFAKLSDYDLYTGPSLSFGYQLNIYPLAFARAFATLVTGRDFRLRLVRERRGTDGKPIPTEIAGPGPRVLSRRTVDWIRTTLSRVVTDPHGTAAKYIGGAELDGWLAGKTGTSFRSNPRTGERVSTASFVGFAPFRKPRWLAISVLQKKQQSHFYGGKYAAPAVRDVFSYVKHRSERRMRARRDAAALDARFRAGHGGVRTDHDPKGGDLK